MNKRLAYFDNFKFILIFLVVLGHFISPLRDFKYIKYLYTFIYLFHMPCFVFILGFFFKKNIKNGCLVTNKWLNYLILYLIMQLILIIINNSSFAIITPKHGLWYLQCIIIWMLLMPVLIRIKQKYLIIISFVLALFVGFDSKIGTVASLSRAFVFLPFFLLGFYFNNEWILKLKKEKYKVILITIFLCIAFLFLYYNFGFNNIISVSYGKGSYGDLGIMGLYQRILWFGIALSLLFLIIVLVPNKRYFFTDYGKNTLQVYCLHIIVYAFYNKYEIYDYFNNYARIVTLLYSVTLLTFFLSINLFSKPFKFLMGLKFKKLLEKE